MVTVQARAPRVYQLVKPGPKAGALFVSQERGRLVLEIANFKRSLPQSRRAKGAIHATAAP